MDPQIMAYVAQAIGGAVVGNILGALTRGGGGIAGRTIIGALGGVGLAFAAAQVPALGNVTAYWSGENALIDGENGGHLANLITGGIGGGVLGLISGLLWKPRG